MKNPRIADQWEPYLAEKRAAVQRLSRELSDAETELNDRVFALFHLTRDEIALLLREVEHYFAGPDGSYGDVAPPGSRPPANDP